MFFSSSSSNHLSFHHASQPITLELDRSTAANTNTNNTNTTTLTDNSNSTRDHPHQPLLSELCRALTPACHLQPLLFNGHLQTMWTAAAAVAAAATARATADEPRIYYRRKIFEADDRAYAGTFAVDFVVDPFEDEDEDADANVEEGKEGKARPRPTLPPRTAYFGADGKEEEDLLAPSTDTCPMLVALHGLSGGSHEGYVREVLAPLVGGGGGGGGWKACVVNSRGCALSTISSGILFNARATWDVRAVINWLHARFPNRPLLAVGFSLGANILVNYLGEEGAGCVLKGAAVCSNPWNLEVGSLALQRTWLGRELYSRVMADGLKRLIEIHKDQVVMNARISLEGVRRAKYLYDFDREIQCPTWGYPTVGAYYRDASSCDALLAVRVPLFALNAEDDPIAVREAIPFDEFKRNPYTVLCTTSKGGHLGWFESGGGRWFVKPMTRFLMTMARQVKVSCPDDLEVPGAGNARFNPVRRKLYIHE
ncbi:MAG: hypothetical protein M1826_002961 [Phylliscum demangeonii]|nr:MAG: hypothetical protein M1826_002961 [Phylliscum demangeonii]